MKHRSLFMLLILATVLSNTGCGRVQPSQTSSSADQGTLVGAWRSKIVFRSGPLAGMKDLEFLYAYNAGGTMTESSNYDEAANSSPPAYGVWKQITPRTFETKYVFFTTKAPGPDDGAPSSADWWPAGHGVLTETITVAEDGQTYSSAIELVTYDRTGSPIAESGGEGTGTATRIVL
jgi:hypothetical protein